MNKTVAEFKANQEKNIKILQSLLDFINEGKLYGLDIEDSFINKIKTAINMVGNERLKVALVGGFSEGKTSIAAAWLEKLDKDSMKINHQESSDEVTVYDFNDEIEIIDTPGLYGFREKLNDNKVEKFKDITKKYISEAHLILYVLNTSNPIKDSHKAELKWMFRELNLLPRTIFVLSKFDEFADMENENDYNEKLSIKKENVKNRLHDLINLSNEEIEKLAIVAVSANPFDEGIVYWLENKEEFRKLSHIAQLQDETENKIIENGGKLALVDNVQKSIVMDILNKQLPVAKELHEAINNGIDKLEDALSIIKDEMNELYYNISQARINLREFTVIYFSGLCDQINGVSLETFNSFVEREIGENGINIDAKVQNEFERQTYRVYGEISKIETNFNQELSFFEKSMLFYGKQGANFLKNSGLINAKNILTGRDVVVKGAKAINWNLDLKFKPWGAIKLADKVNIILIVADIVFEIWDSYKQHQKEKELERVKNKMKENFNRQKDEILSLINDDVKFQEMFFPKVMNLETEIKNIEALLSKEYKRRQDFRNWMHKGEQIIESEIII